MGFSYTSTNSLLAALPKWRSLTQKTTALKSIVGFHVTSPKKLKFKSKETFPFLTSSRKRLLRNVSAAVFRSVACFVLKMEQFDLNFRFFHSA